MTSRSVTRAAEVEILASVLAVVQLLADVWWPMAALTVGAGHLLGRRLRRRGADGDG